MATQNWEMVSSTKLLTDFNENLWGPLLDKTDEMDPNINVEQPASSVNENLSNSGTLILNVGGTINQVKWETIDKFPKSRLQKLRYATCDGW